MAEGKDEALAFGCKVEQTGTPHWDADFKCIHWLSELTKGCRRLKSVHDFECKPFLWRTVEEHDEWDEGKVGRG